MCFQRLGRLAGGSQQGANGVLADAEVALKVGDRGVGVGQLLKDCQGLPVSDQGVVFVADLADERSPGRNWLCQAIQRFATGVVVGLEAVVKVLEEVQRLLQETLAEGLRDPGCSSVRVRRRLSLETASRRQSPASPLLGEGLLILSIELGQPLGFAEPPGTTIPGCARDPGQQRQEDEARRDHAAAMLAHEFSQPVRPARRPGQYRLGAR